jgi:hypothetical protein
MRTFTFISTLLLLVSCGGKDYEILKEENIANISRIQVKLDKKETLSSLEEIAKELREDRSGYDKLWVSFYQSDLLPDESGNGAWAVANFTPELEVKILGQDHPSVEIDAPTITFPHYSSVVEMLNESGDYKENQIETINNNNNDFHIRISSEFLKDESEYVMVEQNKRDIVYVVFQTFAKTDLNKITVTSIPIIRSDFNPNIKYDGQLQKSKTQTVSITRKKAISIIEKFLKIKNFQDLYQLESTIYIPNAKFERLKFAELENVFSDMKK